MARSGDIAGGGSATKRTSPYRAAMERRRLKKATAYNTAPGDGSPWQRLNAKGNARERSGDTLGKQFSQSKVGQTATLNNSSRKATYARNAAASLSESGRFSEAVQRKIRNKIGGVQRKADDRERNFNVSQRDVINKRFGGDAGKALAAMRAEAARQKARKK